VVIRYKLLFKVFFIWKGIKLIHFYVLFDGFDVWIFRLKSTLHRITKSYKLYIGKIKCLDYRGMSDRNPHFQHFPAENVSILNFFRSRCAFVIHFSLEFQTWLFDKVSKSNSPRCIANLNQWTKLRYIFIFTFIWWHVLFASYQCLIWVGICRYQWIVQ